MFLDCSNLSWQKAINQTGKAVSYPVAVTAKQRQNNFCSLKPNIWKHRSLPSAQMVCPAWKENTNPLKKQVCIWVFPLATRVSKLRMLLTWHLCCIYSCFWSFEAFFMYKIILCILDFAAISWPSQMVLWKWEPSEWDTRGPWGLATLHTPLWQWISVPVNLLLPALLPRIWVTST